MLEQKKLPILEALAAFGIGGIFTAACMAGLAYLMANQSLAQSTAWPMVSAIVCAGSFCSGWLMAFFYHSRGLICGAIQGGLFVLLLLGFGLSEGIEPTEMQLARFARKRSKTSSKRLDCRKSSKRRPSQRRLESSTQHGAASRMAGSSTHQTS